MEKDLKEVEYYKWKGIFERTPSYFETEGDRKIQNVPEWCWERYNDELSDKTLKEVYDGIIEAISYYVDMEEDKKKIMALWVIGTYMHDDFETFPLLFLNAMRGSAKSRTVRLLTKLAKDGQMIMSITEATLFRSEGTLGIDEFESLASKEKQSLRELLNAAYKKGTTIKRMRKKKTMEGEEQVAEEFNAYRPIILANINGIDTVLEDRCITITLEKSNNPSYIQLVEDYDSNPVIQDLLLLLKSDKCSLCSVVTKKNIYNYTNWNTFIKHITTYSTFTTLTTQTTLTTPQLELFNKLYESNINGRNLELYFPLLMIAREISEDVFNDVLEIAQNQVELKRSEELSESNDVVLYQMVSGLEHNKYYPVSQLVSLFNTIMGGGNNEWLNNKWMGNAMKRLNLVLHKRRLSQGMEIRVNADKAKDKLEMFK